VSPEIREAVYGTVSVGGHGTATASAGSGAGTGTGTGTDPVREDQPEERDPAEALGPPPADEPPHRVSAWMASLPLLVPLLLIVLNTAATAIERNSQGALGPEDPYEPSTLVAALAFVGNPVVALLIGIVLAAYGLLPRWVSKTQVGGWLSEAAASAGLIILITGAGGALGQVLRDSGVGDELAAAVAAISLPGVMVPFIIASVVRVAQGSGTVAMITADGRRRRVQPAQSRETT